MFAIILGHFLNQSGYIINSSGITQYLFVLLGSASRIAVGIFLMVGCWFMVDTKFKASRVLNLHIQLLFYTLSIFGCLKLLQVHVSVWHTFCCLFPLILFGAWFVSAYIILILLSPFLNKILEWERETLKKLLIILFLLVPLLSMIFINMDTKLCVFMAFIYYYLGIGYYKRYLYEHINLNKYLVLFIGIGIYVILTGLKYYCLSSGISGAFYKIIAGYLEDYHNLLNMVCAFSVFYFFIKTNIGVNKFINYISSVTLTVYIIHQAPGFIHYLWFNVYNCERWLTSKNVILYVLLIPVSLYLVSLICEFIRKKFIVPVVTNLRIYKFMENKINEFYIGIS